jgi:uncharacterized NAD(P)/FAD-binding protein YdhS
MTAYPSVIIIGGGASGVLLAAHLLRSPAAPNVTLIERRPQIGQGVAYSTRENDHLLNVAASGMSAFGDDPEHFWRWLRRHNLVADGDDFVFVPRRHYATYLADVLAEASQDGRLSIVNGTAIDVNSTANGVEVMLDDQTSLVAHAAVLAVGHEEHPVQSRRVAIRAGSEADTPLDPLAPVMILGSGLSMVDAWLTLAHAEHKGPVTVVSRHGLLPKTHREVAKMQLEAADVPFGTSIHYFARWFRDTVAEAVRAGGDWRSAVDALRPFNQRIWQNWSEISRRRFLAHLRPFWNVHRHRLPPRLHDNLVAAVSRGQVALKAGEVIELAETAGGVRATIRPKGGTETIQIDVARVYDCGGVTVDVGRSSNPVIAALLRRSLGRPDALHIGLDVTTACEVIDAAGRPSNRLFAIGPLTRGTFFEIEAIPDIRIQAAALTAHLTGRD